MVENSVQFVNVGRGLFLGRVVFFQEYQGEWLALLAQGGGGTCLQVHVHLPGSVVLVQGFLGRGSCGSLSIDSGV